MNTSFLLILTFTLLTVSSAPVDDTPAPSLATSESTSPEVPQTTTTTGSVPPCEKTTDVYDSSQNGTDNYRVKVKGFTLLLAPSDALIGAAMMLGGFGDEALAPTRLHDQPAQRTIQTHSKLSKLLHMLKKLNN